MTNILLILLCSLIAFIILGYLLRSQLKWIISILIGDILYIGEKGSRYFTENLFFEALRKKKKIHIKKIISGTYAGIMMSSDINDLVGIMDNPGLGDDKGKDIFCPLIPGLKDNKTFAGFFIDLSEEGYQHRQASVVKYIQNRERVEKCFYSCVEEFTKVFDSWVASQKTLSIFDALSDVIFRVTAREFLGWDNVDPSEIRKAASRAQAAVNFGLPMTPFSKGIKFIKETNEAFRAIFKKIFEDNKESMLRTDNYSRFIAQQSADARGGKLEDHLTHDDMFAGSPLLLVGITNIGNNLSRFLLGITVPEVCEDKQLVEKIRKEMETIKDRETSIISFEAVKKSKLIDELYLETLRFGKAVRLVARIVSNPIKSGDVTIPAGTFIALPMGNISDNKETWGEDVLKFRPNRFDDKDIKGDNPKKANFCPFSLGKRSCPAFMVTRAACLAFFVAFFGYKQYRLILDPNNPPFDNTDELEGVRSLSPEYRARMVIDDLSKN